VKEDWIRHMKPGKLYHWNAAVHPYYQNPMMFIDFTTGGYLKMLNDGEVTMFFWVASCDPREMWKRLL